MFQNVGISERLFFFEEDPKSTETILSYTNNITSNQKGSAQKKLTK
jgi:hypothetical protein